MNYGIWGCYNESGDLLYIGFTSKDLIDLEWQERNWHKFPTGVSSYFRNSLRKMGKNWTFEWIQLPREVPASVIEIEKGALVRYTQPPMNEEMFPYERNVATA